MANSFTSHQGAGAPMATAFSMMLPSSVTMYHTSTTGHTRPGYWMGSASTGRLVSTISSSRSAPAATTTTTIIPILCQIPSRAWALDHSPTLQAAADPVR